MEDGMNRMIDVGTSIASTLARLGSGAGVGRRGDRPVELLEIFEFENCPYCRKVREALSILDLDAMIYPCPKQGPRYRNELIERGGKAQFPYLIDSNTGKEMYESDDIVNYLFSVYGDGPPPMLLTAGFLNDATTMLASVTRPFASGRLYRAALAPDKALELYSFEASPFCRIVREALTSLELPYRLRNVAKGSDQREALRERAGKVMVPYLIDPNTDTEMFESAKIVEYLESTYALPV
jgi:glutathione S-transferase